MAGIVLLSMPKTTKFISQTTSTTGMPALMPMIVMRTISGQFLGCSVFDCKFFGLEFSACKAPEYHEPKNAPVPKVRMDTSAQ